MKVKSQNTRYTKIEIPNKPEIKIFFLVSTHYLGPTKTRNGMFRKSQFYGTFRKINTKTRNFFLFEKTGRAVILKKKLFSPLTFSKLEYRNNDE